MYHSRPLAFLGYGHPPVVLPGNISSAWAACWKRRGASTRGDFATTSLSGNTRFDPGRRRRAFMKDCARIWGNKYDYCRAKYKDNHSPVKIGCSDHGSFWLRPRDHIQRRIGCPKCSKVSIGQSSPSVPSTPLLGQHLLRSTAIADAIAAVVVRDDEEETSVAEIGVGAGALTVPLLRRQGCRKLFGFELDPAMVPKACASVSRARLGTVVSSPLPPVAVARTRDDWPQTQEAASARCIIYQGDVLTAAALPAECEIAAGNVPYRISAGIVLWLLGQRPPLRRIVLMVQLEFARRLLARPGSPKYGRLAVLSSILCLHRETVAPYPIPPEAFDPPPRVDSAVVRLEPRPETASPMRTRGVDVPLKLFDSLLRVLFDDVRGPARGHSIEATLEPHAKGSPLPPGIERLPLPSGWRTAVARSDVGHLPAVALLPEDLLALAAELVISAIAGRRGSRPSAHIPAEAQNQDMTGEAT
eukprot:TRINITY_DN44902_c0_g1_i1.p1 TRINITY_DN44902_c0_g1~~TRINITY_DN44902_c0_g1_i1.p1  ORF type:complete len:473 (+),score=58.85 TRINITY_DN44902_c0_g1_i1:48-1466(+)